MTEQTSSATEPENDYDVVAIQDKWLPIWDEMRPFASGNKADPRPKKYVLDMFPYPSGDLHMGHAEAYALGDVIARYWVQRGFNVMHPIGWDSFGLPAENAAIKRGLDPRGWTYDNIAQQKSSMRRYACSFDWDRVLVTSDSMYYRWNQWLFLEFYKKGLAYRKNSLVNWCPSCQTVLANEQVVQGLCERCDSVVTKKALTQWFFKVTDYADRLLDDLDTLEGNWPSKVLSMQRNRIGGDDIIIAQQSSRAGFARARCQSVEALAAAGFEMQAGAELECAGKAAECIAKIEPRFDAPETEAARAHLVAAQCRRIICGARCADAAGRRVVATLLYESGYRRP